MKQNKLIFGFIAAMLLCVYSTFAQQGMDYDTQLGPTWRFSRLRVVGNNPQTYNNMNEKAVGVYHSSIFPASALEINTNFTHMPAFLTTPYLRGEVFRTSAPANVIARWRFLQGTDEMFQLFSPANSNDVSLQATNNGNMFFNTATTNRVRINQTLTTPIFGVNQNVSGYMGIAPNGFFANNSPWSLLHLEGPNNTSYTGAGWRRWMKTGMFIYENSDAMYVGMMDLGTNRSDAIINWSDDAALYDGVDKLRFIFTSVATTGNGNNTNPIDGCSLNGYEYMRMAASTTLNGANFPVGYIGIGPVFTNTLPPQSRLHINAEDALSTYIQITNQNPATGTGQTTLDGTRLGILDNGTALLYNQENRHLILSTNTSVPANAAAPTNERIRITATGTLLTPNPLGIPNMTRVSISHDPAAPVDLPRSLLHLGYNVSPTLDGWRQWMDVGMFISHGTDNVYLGLKDEGTPQNTDRQDAVLNWGDNPINNTNQGPDNLRFIFTSTQAGFNIASPANTEDGLEIARMTPLSYVGIGPVFTNTNAPRRRLDIHDDGNQLGMPTPPFINPVLPNTPNGRPQLRLSHTISTDDNGAIYTDFQTTGGNNTIGAGNLLINPRNMEDQMGYVAINMLNATTAPNPNLSLDVNGQQNIRTVNQDDNITKILVWDDLTTTEGRIKWKDVNSFPGGGFGASCTNAIPFNLSDDWRIGINFHNFYFDGQSNGSMSALSSVGIGYDCSPLYAKLDVRQANGYLQNTSSDFGYSLSGRFINETYAINGGILSGGILCKNLSNAVIDYGIWSMSLGNPNNTYYNYGVVGQAVGGSLLNVGVWGFAPIGTGNFAGLFNGDVYVNGSQSIPGYVLTGSDSIIKENITNIPDALQTISSLKPHSFTFKRTEYPYLNLPDGQQYGLVAQEVENVIPELVSEVKVPEDIDTAGNVTNHNLTLKTLNYTGLIPIAIQAIKELDATVTDIKAVPEPPILITPADADTMPCTQLNFGWHKSHNAAFYTVSFSLNPDMQDIRWQKNTVDTLLEIIGFELDTTIYWAVKAVNIFQKESPYSEIRSFYYNKTPRSPVLIEPVYNDTLTEGAPVLWTEVDCASYYTIYVSRTPDESGLILSSVIYPEQSVLVPMLEEGTYYWWLTACSQWGICSEPSEIRSFYFTEEAPTGNPLLSDEQLKTDINPIIGALDKVLQLNGIYFRWALDSHPELMDSTQQIGLIAQEVLPVVPEVVVKNVQGYYAIDYARLVSVLIESIKELNSKIEAQQEILNICCADTKTMNQTTETETNNTIVEKAKEEVINVTDIELANSGAVLYQNAPNPFGDGTAIRYYIPEGVKEAVIIFHNEYGQELKKVNISDRGMGIINLSTPNLTAGIYTYGLIIDGKLIETKRMMRVK